jgi:hypothetical protein
MNTASRYRASVYVKRHVSYKYKRFVLMRSSNALHFKIWLHVRRQDLPVITFAHPHRDWSAQCSSVSCHSKSLSLQSIRLSTTIYITLCRIRECREMIMALHEQVRGCMYPCIDVFRFMCLCESVSDFYLASILLYSARLALKALLLVCRAGLWCWMCVC